MKMKFFFVFIEKKVVILYPVFLLIQRTEL